MSQIWVFIVEAILGVMGSESLPHLGTLSTRLSMGSLIFIAAFSMRYNCHLYLEVVSMVVVSHPILCPVVREWWAGQYSMWIN